MKSKLLITVICLIVLNLSQCTAANYWNYYNNSNNTNPTPDYSNPTILFFRGGYLFHLNKIPGGLGNNVEAKLSGTKCSHSFLYLVSIGDSSLEAAIKEAKIQKVASVSYEQLGILAFVYHRFCTTVAGE